MSLGFLAQMGWKSALISGVALALLLLLRSRSAADRAAVLRLAVALLLALPFISILLPALQIETPEAARLAAPEAVMPLPLASEPLTPAIEAALPITPAPAEALLPNPELLAAFLYFAGALLLAVRLLAGVMTLRRWTAGAEAVTHPAWRAALERSACGRDVRLLLSRHVPAPMSWGMRRPVILLDPETAARPHDADAVVAHEMAHVIRADWSALMLSRLAVALFWFNPLVWLVERQAIRQAEEAADCAAVDRVEPTHYAETLVSCARRSCGHAVPANSIAPTGRDLGLRVRAILDGTHRTRRSGSRWTLAAMGSCVAFAVPVAAMELVPAAAELLPPPPSPIPAPTVSAPAAPAVLPPAPPAPAAPQIPEAASVTRAAPPVPPAPAFSPAAPVPPVEVQITSLPHGARIAVATSGAAIAIAPPAPAIAAGPQPPQAPHARARAQARARISAHDLVAMRIHGITPEYAREMAAAARASISSEDLVAMRIHGVTARFAAEVAAAGYRADAEDLVAMRIHGVTSERARRARRDNPRISIDDLVAQAVQGEHD